MNYDDLLNTAYENVEVNIEESHERFEVPKVTGHHEKNRTVITNFLQIASHIRRDPQHIIKFLTKELASQAEIQNERLIFARKLSSKEINDKILRYVSQFVLCANCKKPDTKIIESEGKVYVQCLACGEKTQIHKL
jgi:translation initiation factor 2 subunit 2